MSTEYSQGIWRQNKLQVHARESEAAWATEVFFSQNREPLEKHESKIPLKKDHYLNALQCLVM